MRAIDLSASQGAAVLTLLERAKVPPFPAFYGLLYDYVAGVEGLLASRIRGILADGETNGGAGEKLYAEFVAPYENREAFEAAVASLTARLKTLDQLLVASERANDEQAQSLRAATVGLTDALDPRLLRDWIGRLQSANDGLRHANAALARELEAAAAELHETQSQIAGLKEQQRRDPLTGLANRAGIDLEISRLVSARGQLSCAVLDIDYFKSLNDRYGHQAGDQVLRLVARALLVAKRETDIVGRMGGDEFVVILPQTDLAAASLFAERVRTALMESDLRTALGSTVLGGVTASIGLATLRPDDTITRLIERADGCLYEAKRQGRNRVIAEQT